jgi:hypothetical protein
MSSVPKAIRSGLVPFAKRLIYLIPDPAPGRGRGTKTPIPFHRIQIFDHQGKRLYLTAEERHAFIAAAATTDRPVRTLRVKWTHPLQKYPSSSS